MLICISLFLFAAFQPCGFGIWPKASWKFKPLKVQHFSLSSKIPRKNKHPPSWSFPSHIYPLGKISAPQKIGTSTTGFCVIFRGDSGHSFSFGHSQQWVRVRVRQSHRKRSTEQKEKLKPEFLTGMALNLCVCVGRASLIPSAWKEK